RTRPQRLLLRAHTGWNPCLQRRRPRPATPRRATPLRHLRPLNALLSLIVLTGPALRGIFRSITLSKEGPMFLFLRRTTFACLFAFLLSSSALVAAQVTNFDGAPFSSTADQLRAASAAVPIDHEHSVQILLNERQYIIGDSGTVSYRYRLIFRVDSQDAVDGWSEMSANWDPWFEGPAQLHARVLESDGRFVELDQSTITDAPVKGDDPETYSSEHVRRAPLPGVSVGAIVEEYQETDEKTPYFANGGLYRTAFRTGVPVARERLVVDMPASIPFKDSITGLPTLAVTRKVADGRRHIVYEQTAIPAAHVSDISLPTNDPETPMV